MVIVQVTLKGVARNIRSVKLYVRSPLHPSNALPTTTNKASSYSTVPLLYILGIMKVCTFLHKKIYCQKTSLAIRILWCLDSFAYVESIIPKVTLECF